MKHWIEESASLELGSSRIVGEAAEGLAARLDEIASGGYPRLVSVSQSDGHDDVHEYEVIVELAPDVVLPAKCGLLESVEEGWDPPIDANGIVQSAMAGVSSCMPVIGRLSDQLHEVRIRARRVFGGWASMGVQSHLVEVRLAPYDSWGGSSQPGVVLLVEGCDEQLRTSVAEVQVADVTALEGALEKFKVELECRLEARERLAQAGASGTIDRLALNAISHFGDVAATLRRFDTERRFWLPDATALLMREGEVTASNSDASRTVVLGRGRVTFVGDLVPETTLVAATGRPVTDLAEHPFLSSDMTVIEAHSSIEHGIPMVTVDLDMPHWLFCTTTGRIWQQEPDGSPRRVAS